MGWLTGQSAPRNAGAGLLETTWLGSPGLAALVLFSDTPEAPGVRAEEWECVCVCLERWVTVTTSSKGTLAHRHALTLKAEGQDPCQVLADSLGGRRSLLWGTGIPRSASRGPIVVIIYIKSLSHIPYIKTVIYQYI